MEVDLAVVQAHAQWWSPDLKSKMEAGPSDAVEGADGAISAWVADECNRVLGKELPQEEEKRQAALVHEGKRQELEAWEKFEVFLPLHECKVQKQMVDTRWVTTWKMVGCKTCAKVCMVATGLQDPGLKDGLVNTSGCFSLRSSHLPVISLSAIRNWKSWSLGIKNAFFQADGFERNVFLHAPSEWYPPCQKKGAGPQGAGIWAERRPGGPSSLFEAS